MGASKTVRHLCAHDLGDDMFHEWVRSAERPVYLDASGTHRGHNYRWVIYRCNNMQCMAKALVKQVDIDDIVTGWLNADG